MSDRQPSAASLLPEKLTGASLRARLGRQAHLWRLHHPGDLDASLDPRLVALLSDEERQRCARLRPDGARQRFLLAHAFKRLVLARYLAVAPGALQFEADSDGRPGLASNPPAEGEAGLPSFSLSHTAGCVVLLVSALPVAGVDVQAIVGVDDPLQVAGTYCSSEERAWLAALPADRCRERFFELWALREAYLKACGTVELPPDQFSFELNGGRDRAIRIAFAANREDDPAAWQFSLSRPTASHVLAAALRRGQGEDDLEVVSWAASDPRALLEPGGAR